MKRMDETNGRGEQMLGAKFLRQLFLAHWGVVLLAQSVCFGFTSEDEDLQTARFQIVPATMNPQEYDDLVIPNRDDGQIRPEAKSIDKSWFRRDIRNLRIDIREHAAVSPPDRSGELDYGIGVWGDQFGQPSIYHWVAPDIQYAQLYFEDVALERYGQTSGPYRQFFRSGIHFFRSVAMLPNKVCNDSPRTLDYPLGYCRPGSAAPLTRTRHYRPLHR